MVTNKVIETEALNVHRAYALIAFNLGIAKYEEVIEGTSLPQDINCVPLYIKLSDVLRIVHQVDLTVNDRYWSVELGEKLGISSHGAVGAAALSAGTVGQAIETFVQWFLLRCNVYKYSVSYQSNCVEVKMVDISGDPLFEQVFFNAFARAIEVMIEQLYGTFDWHDIQLSTKQIAAQGDSLQHRYKSQIIFDCAHNSVKLSHNIWNALNPLADDAAHQTHSNDCKMLAKSQQQNISIKQRVEAIIEQHYADVMAGRKETNIPPTLIVICEQLNMTERTLIRQLKQADTSYKQILSARRKKYALTLLKSDRTTNEIAELLGYSDVANFCRAFKVWFSETPTGFRQRTKEKC